MPSNHNRHHDFALAVRITGNMPRKLVHIIHPDSPHLRSSSPTHSLPEPYALTRDLAHERAQDQLRIPPVPCGRWVKGIEAHPVDSVGRRGKGFKSMVEKGGGVGEIAGSFGRQSLWSLGYEKAYLT